MAGPPRKSDPDDEWEYSASEKEAQRRGAETTMYIANMGRKVQEWEAKRKLELCGWFNKESCIQLLQQGLNERQGLYPPPHVLPYKPIGIVDLQCDRSLVPEYKFYKRPRSRKEHKKKEAPKQVPEDELLQSMDSISLPLNLKHTFWNGERWCGVEFSSRTAEIANGYQMLHEELTKSQNRLKNTKMGRFFLDGLRLEEPRTKSIHYPRVSKQILTKFQPYIPPLPLANLAKYQIDLQIEENKRLLGLYRDEAKRTLHSYRLATYEASKDSARDSTPTTERFGGLPLKACNNLALQQLEDVLAKGTKFETLQAEYNFELLKQLAATRSTRAYTFARNYAALKGLRSPKNVVCDMESTPRRAEQFRNMLLKYPWFEVLISLIHHNGRRPSTAEVYILDYIRFVIGIQHKFDAINYCNMIYTLQKKKLNLNSLSIHRALHFIKESISISDMDIIEHLLSAKVTRLPYWLEARDKMVGRVKRKLETNIFSTNTFNSSSLQSPQPTTRMSSQSNLKSSQSSTRSIKRIIEISSIHKTNL